MKKFLKYIKAVITFNIIVKSFDLYDNKELKAYKRLLKDNTIEVVSCDKEPGHAIVSYFKL